MDRGAYFPLGELKSGQLGLDGVELIMCCFTCSGLRSCHSPGVFQDAGVRRLVIVLCSKRELNRAVNEFSTAEKVTPTEIHRRLKTVYDDDAVDRSTFEKPQEIAALVDDTDKSSLLTKLLGCKYIIYDISENLDQVNEAKWAIEALDKEITAKKENGETNEPINFILISTVLTWALTKPTDPEEPNEPFTEDDYRLRRAHINYKNHLALEKEVIKIGKKAISNALGSGKLGKTTKEEALALKDMTEEVYNHMTMNLNMQPRYILENMSLEYVPDDNELNFLENIDSIVAEFVMIHGLKPIKIFIHGPPMSGKTFLANRICRHYQLHYLTLDNVLRDFNDKMEEKLRALEKKEQASQKSGSSTAKEDENDDETDDEDDNEELMELYQSLKEANFENISQEEDVIIK
ncbi:adenylate kinase 7-like [Hetaerina americana]|uniref:adenylate kinase 7-like n=1 Tax=Hetaerina americana TaxID=62018 RepID=UPI003A7F2605